LFNHCFLLSYFAAPWKQAKSDSLTEARQGPRSPSKFTTDKPPVKRVYFSRNLFKN
jgi:hypothetical protein